LSTERTLKGKTLFISGASRGIGKAIALRAAQDGANIIIAAKTTTEHPKLPGTIDSAAAEIEAAGPDGVGGRRLRGSQRGEEAQGEEQAAGHGSILRPGR